MVYLIYEILRPSNALPIDLSALFFGGNLAPATHAAELCEPTLAKLREAGAAMKAVARDQNVDLRFASIVQPNGLLNWAEKRDAKLMLSGPLPV